MPPLKPLKTLLVGLMGKPLVAWLPRIMRLPRRPLTTNPTLPRRTTPVATLPRRPAPLNATMLANPLSRNLRLSAHTHTATKIGGHVQLRVPHDPKTSQRVAIPKHPAFPDQVESFLADPRLECNVLLDSCDSGMVFHVDDIGRPPTDLTKKQIVSFAAAACC